MHSPSLSLLMWEGFVNEYDRIYEFGLVCIVENPPALARHLPYKGCQKIPFIPHYKGVC